MSKQKKIKSVVRKTVAFKNLKLHYKLCMRALKTGKTIEDTLEEILEKELK